MKRFFLISSRCTSLPDSCPPGTVLRWRVPELYAACSFITQLRRPLHSVQPAFERTSRVSCWAAIGEHFLWHACLTLGEWHFPSWLPAEVSYLLPSLRDHIFSEGDIADARPSPGIELEATFPTVVQVWFNWMSCGLIFIHQIDWGTQDLNQSSVVFVEWSTTKRNRIKNPWILNIKDFFFSELNRTIDHWTRASKWLCCFMLLADDILVLESAICHTTDQNAVNELQLFLRLSISQTIQAPLHHNLFQLQLSFF